MSIPIRLAVPGDAHALAQIHVTASRASHVGIVPETDSASLTFEMRLARWTTLLNAAHPERGFRAYVAEGGSGLIGFGACGDQRTPALAARGFSGEVWLLNVMPNHQRAGIGLALMRRMAEDLTERGFRGAALWVLEQNRPARRFYERCGGVLVADRIERIGSSRPPGVAYGWRHLGLLTAATRASTRR